MEKSLKLLTFLGLKIHNLQSNFVVYYDQPVIILEKTCFGVTVIILKISIIK